MAQDNTKTTQPTQPIVNPFQPTQLQTGGDTTPSFAPQLTPLEETTNKLVADTKAKFPDAPQADVLKGVGSFLFKSNPPTFKPTPLSTIVDDAKTHAFFQTHPELAGQQIGQGASVSKISPADTIKASQSAQEKLGMGPGMTIYSPFDNGPLAGVRVPDDFMQQQRKFVTELPARIVNTAEDIKHLLTTGNLPSNATKPYDPATGKGRKVNTFANDQLDMYQAATEAGFSNTAATWISALYGFGAGTLDVATAGQFVDGLSKSVVSHWSNQIDTIDATTKLGNPATLDDANAAYKKMAHEVHPDKIGGDTTKMAELNKAWETVKQNGGPINPSRARYMIADISYRLQGAAGDALTAGFAGPERAAAGNIAGLLPGYAPKGTPQIPFGLSTAEMDPVGFGEEDFMGMSDDMPPADYNFNGDLKDASYKELSVNPEYQAWEGKLMDLSKKTAAAEKDPIKEPYSAEAQKISEEANWNMKDTHAVDVWEKFSKARGYTPAEIAQYKEFQNQIEAGQNKFGLTSEETFDILYGSGPISKKASPAAPEAPKRPTTVTDAQLFQGELFKPRPDYEIKSPVALPDSGMKQINRLLSIQPMSPLNFGIGLTPDGATIDMSESPAKLLARAGKRQVVNWTGSVNGKTALVDMVTEIINKSADITTPFDKSVMGAYQDLLSNLEKTKALELMIQVGDPRLNFVPPGEKNSLAKIYQEAINALRNDPGGEVLAPQTPVPLSSQPTVQTIPSQVASEIYDKWVKNTQITGSDILSQEDVSSFKEQASTAETEMATQRTTLGEEDLFAKGETAPKTGLEYSEKSGPEVTLTPEQKGELDKLKKSGLFSDADIEEFKKTMMGKPLVLTPRATAGASAGMRGVGEGGLEEIKNIASGKSSVPITTPKAPEEIAQSIVSENFVRAAANKFGLSDQEIKEIADELTADVQRKGAARASAPAKKFGSFLKSYLPGEGALQARLAPLVDALTSGDLSAIEKFAAQPDIPKEKFQEVLQKFDSAPIRDQAALSNAIIDTFNPPLKGNNKLATANAFLKNIGYPGNVESMLKDINAGLSTAVEQEKIPHINPSNGNARPSKYYMGKQMMDNYFNFTGAEGKAMGFIKNTLSNYLNRITYFPEAEGRDLFGVGDTEEGIKAPDEGKKTSVTGASGISTRTQYGQGRIFEHPLDALEAGARPRVLNYEIRMKDYGYKYARAYSTQSMVNAISAGKIGGWYPSRPSDAQDWIDLGRVNQAFEHHIAIKGADGTPSVMRQSLWVPKSFGNKLMPIIKPFSKPQWISNVRALQSYNKYITLSLSPFHAKQLSIVAAAAAGPKNIGMWFNTKLTDPAFSSMELEFLHAGGITTSLDKKVSNFIKLKFGEEASGEVLRNTKLKEIPGVGKALDKIANNPLTRLFDKGANMVTDLTFDKMQRFYKVTAYSSRMADWMGKHPTATDGQISAARAEMASLVNGFFGGLNFEALGWGKGAQEVGRSLLLALDWTVSNGIPAWRAIAGRPQYLTDISEPDAETGEGGGRKWDPDSLKFVAKSVLGGMFITQMFNYILNGKLSEDWTNVTIGIDSKGKEIKANLFFAGDTRDIINLLNYTNQSGWAGVYQFAESKAAPGVKTAIELATGAGKDPIGNNIWNPWDSMAQKLWKGSLYAAKGVVPVPISINNPIAEYQKYGQTGTSGGGVTTPEAIIAATGFGYISHKHMSQMLENNFWQSKTDITSKIQRKEPLTARELAISQNILRNGSKVKQISAQRAKIGADTTLPYDQKYNEITALDDQMSTLIAASLNPTDADIMKAADQLQRQQERATVVQELQTKGQ